MDSRGPSDWKSRLKKPEDDGDDPPERVYHQSTFQDLPGVRTRAYLGSLEPDGTLTWETWTSVSTGNVTGDPPPEEGMAGSSSQPFRANTETDEGSHDSPPTAE